MRKRLIALLPFFVRYVCIGGFVFVLDIGSFQGLIVSGVYRPLATTLSYLLAISTHFTLNRVLNFRNFDRPGSSQLRTYLVVAGFSWVITMIVIEGCVRWVDMLPLHAKILAVAINIPIGFLGHRLFTFGPGLRYWIRRVLGHPNPAPHLPLESLEIMGLQADPHPPSTPRSGA